MEFYTAVNCMDGRVQIPVITYLQRRFDATYVDMITEPGPNRLLADQTDPALVESIITRVKISIEAHGSGGVAVVGHHDCAGNPASEEEQSLQTKNAVRLLRKECPGTEIIGLWLNENWEVSDLQVQDEVPIPRK
jgi:carbonic anhydrase